MNKKQHVICKFEEFITEAKIDNKYGDEMRYKSLQVAKDFVDYMEDEDNTEKYNKYKK